MAMQSFALSTARIAKYKGEILSHAVPLEVLGKTGRQIPMPKNNSDTIVCRKWLPYGATATSASTQNQFFQNGTGDRGNVIVQAHQTQEGVTPSPDNITPLDITVVMQQYSCLYGFTDKTADLYEDDIPKAMITQIGERVTFVNEMIIWGALRACTNQFFGGTGTTVATVNGGLTLGLIRKIAKNLQANHGKPVNKVLRASNNFGTDAVAEGYTVYCHTDLEPDIRDLPNFIPAEKYASGTPMPNETWLGLTRKITGWILPARFPARAPAPATGSTAAAPVLLRTSFVHGQPPALELLLVELRAGRLAIRGIRHFDEAKTARLAGCAITHQMHRCHLADRGEQAFEPLLVRVERQISYVQSHCTFLSERLG